MAHPIWRELERMAEQIGKEQPVGHADPSATDHDSGTAHTGSKPARDCARAGHLAPERAQSPAVADNSAILSTAAWVRCRHSSYLFSVRRRTSSKKFMTSVTWLCASRGSEVPTRMCVS